MGYDYALVHLKYTIPPACLLTFILKPLLTRLDLYKTFTLILVAFFATLPWDSYLIRNGIWTYPPDAIAGPRLFKIPVEELFFFVVQTYITSMLYILLSKPVLHAQFLTSKDDSSLKSRRIRTAGQVLLIGCVIAGISLVKDGGQGTYLGLILIWACPVALLTWSFSGYFLIRLPPACVVVPIVLPTVYLWIVDEFALGRGTWAIESGTKLGWCLWGSLELEEAVFFLFTNALIVFGLIAFDRGLAVLYAFPEIFPVVPYMPPPSLLAKAVLLDPVKYDMARIKGIREAVQTLRRKSRSFYLASSVFPGRLRIDLVLLYSFCRVADDLMDEAHGESEATLWIKKLTGYLDHVYGSDSQLPSSIDVINDFVGENFPGPARSALILLPTKLLPSKPFYELLEGFKMDLCFSGTNTRHRTRQFPIQDEGDLELYAHRVASTVGELCLRLVFHHSTTKLPSDKESILVFAARTMGHALQYVNIARDISVDGEIGRVYLPSDWLKQEDLTPHDVIKDPTQPKVEMFRHKLLDWAFKEYGRSRDIMNMLPYDVRGPLIVAVESYMEIGRVLRERTGVPSETHKGRATVPRSRRIWVAWKNLSTV
ncbi:Squalene/phytoene synthase-domain-containing protein [Daldinia decipiens]|uniref:Squalene/phytoene synthase-domain-containing protein n=1 Tax=Daldinia decipiens TaxID=326647 RepID=UPI0020C3A092|nr:Squalene/phytoene synthase-domain-containing protein [Daldinia decipiens]KAI1654660.1 Squalene/phytoene synthase-domain-containing protein [Daldinia decipiens]